MKSQSVIFLAVLGLIVVLSTAQNTDRTDITAEKVQALIIEQGPCILGPKNFTKCDPVGKMLKVTIPQLFKGCTLTGCPNGNIRIKQYADLIRKSNQTIWEMAINKYVLHNKNATTTTKVLHKQNATTTTNVPHKQNATTTTVLRH